MKRSVSKVKMFVDRPSSKRSKALKSFMRHLVKKSRKAHLDILIHRHRKAPKRSGKAPKRSGKAPKRSGKAPKRSGKAPKRSGKAPKRSGKAPKRSGKR
jgi:hypothetical protein